MSVKTIPDGAGISNHFSLSFPPHVIDINATSVTGFADETEVIDGPDSRGYSTGKAMRQTLTVEIPSHDPGALAMHAWREKCENAAPGHFCTGTATKMDAADNPIAILELTHCICFKFEGTDNKMDGGEVEVDKFSISYYRAKRIGP